MEVKTLTTEEQIEVLKLAKMNFVKEYNKHKSNHRIQEWGIPFLSEGLHFHIAKAFEQLGGEFLPYELLLEKMIPLYNFENATNHSENTTIEGFDFWARDNYKDILAFLDWMISELEKQLNN